MNKNKTSLTKDKIIRISAKMFSAKGYEKVTVRVIAAAAGINAASIYRYFLSKREILDSMYKYFIDQQNKRGPSLDTLLQMAETEPPLDVLMKTQFYYDEKDQEFLDNVVATASKMIHSDEESERFIRVIIIDCITHTLKPILQHMISLKKIKPFDIDTFLKVLSGYCYSTAVLNATSLKHDKSLYDKCMEFIYSSVIVNDGDNDYEAGL